MSNSMNRKSIEFKLENVNNMQRKDAIRNIYRMTDSGNFYDEMDGGKVI